MRAAENFSLHPLYRTGESHTEVDCNAIFNRIRQAVHPVPATPNAKWTLEFAYGPHDFGCILGRLREQDAPRSLAGTQ